MNEIMREAVAWCVAELNRVSERLAKMAADSGPGSDARADADSGAAPGCDSGPGPGDEPIRVVLTPDGEAAEAGLGLCGSCGSMSAVGSNHCQTCGSGRIVAAPATSTN